MKKVILIALVALQSCVVTQTPQNQLKPTLESVEHEGEGVHGGQSFQNDMILIKWSSTPTSLDFDLQNKTSKTIKIIWEEAVYINEKGESNRIMHKGVKYIDRSQSMPPTVVVRGSTVSETCVPVDNVRYSGGQYGSGWVESPLFNTMAWTTTESQRLRSLIVGKTVSVLLPIQSEGVTKEYIFNFKVQ